MERIIRIGIIGFGNVGKGVLRAVEKNSDTELIAIFTRRPKVVRDEVRRGIFVFETEQAYYNSGSRIDVAILCGRSKEDLPTQGPKLARKFNTVDSFDDHANIPAYFDLMNRYSGEGGNVSIISAGWDPGIISVEKVLGDAFLPDNKTYTGYSDAARKVAGVADARQCTGSVLVACARAAFRLNEMRKKGAFTMLDIPPCYFSPHSSAVLREKFM